MAVTVYTEEHFAQTKVDVVEGQLFQIRNKKDKVSNDDSQEVEVVDGIQSQSEELSNEGAEFAMPLDVSHDYGREEEQTNVPAPLAVDRAETSLSQH